MVTCLQQYEDGAYYNTDNGLAEIPRDIPEGVSRVHLMFNVISRLERGDRFPENCAYINLAYNRISQIEARVFPVSLEVLRL